MGEPQTKQSLISPGISAVVPVYNSEATLAKLIERLEPVLLSMAPDYEITLVNDGSRDGSWRVIQSLTASHPRVFGINLMRNYGQHNALLCGIRSARMARIVTLDDDLQNPPEEIARMLATMDQGFDVVYGSPESEQHGLFRDLASQITKLVLQKAMGAQTARRISAFRIFDTRLREAFATYNSPYVSIDVLLTWGTTRFTAITVRHDARPVGKSNYTLGKLMTHAINMMTGFSTWPLRVASLMGFGFTILGMLLLVYVVAMYLIHGRSVPGFAFLASIISVFSGAQLFALGIIGEYLARVHFRMMDRPSYAIRAAVGLEKT